MSRPATVEYAELRAAGEVGRTIAEVRADYRRRLRAEGKRPATINTCLGALADLEAWLRSIRNVQPEASLKLAREDYGLVTDR